MAEKITVTFLGTGSSIPTQSKNHPATLITYKDQNLLFDCGEGTQRQFRRAKLNPCKISKLFITHWHGDHTLGIPGLLQTLALNNYNGMLEIHGPIGTKKNMKVIIDFYMPSYLKKSKEMHNTFDIKVYEHTPQGIILDTEEYCISAFALDHGINAMGYTFEIKEKLRINKEKLTKLNVPNSPLLKQLALGKNIVIKNKTIKAKEFTYTEPKRSIAYISDTRYTKDLAKQAKDADLLIIEATYAENEKETAHLNYHLTAKQAATIAKQAKVKHLALVHLSQRYEYNQRLIKAEAKAVFDKKISIPKDLDTLML